MTPSVGRIVHWQTAPGVECQAAIITQVYDDGTVDLKVFPGSDLDVWSPRHIHQMDNRPGDVSNWHAPEYVPQPTQEATS